MQTPGWGCRARNEHRRAFRGNRLINYRRRWVKAGFLCCLILALPIINTYLYDKEHIRQDRIMATAFISRMNAGQSRVAEINPGAWDVVCHLEAYENPEYAVPDYLSVDAASLTFIRSPRMVGENETSLAFIDSARREVTVQYFDRKEIFEIIGSTCLGRERASFSVVPASYRPDKFLAIRLISADARQSMHPNTS
jgi:hypothetical protein